jgi:hypothetical protein
LHWDSTFLALPSVTESGMPIPVKKPTGSTRASPLEISIKFMVS